jgi:hypothetical protein
MMAQSNLLFLLSTVAVLSATVQAFQYSIGTPTQCGSLDVQFSQGTGPYRLIIVPVSRVLHSTVIVLLLMPISHPRRLKKDRTTSSSTSPSQRPRRLHIRCRRSQNPLG